MGQVSRLSFGVDVEFGHEELLAVRTRDLVLFQSFLEAGEQLLLSERLIAVLAELVNVYEERVLQDSRQALLAGREVRFALLNTRLIE